MKIILVIVTKISLQKSKLLYYNIYFKGQTIALMSHFYDVMFT